MTTMELTPSQIRRIILSEIDDALSAAEKRSAAAPSTGASAGGRDLGLAALCEEERRACARRIQFLFGLEAPLNARAAAALDDWVNEIDAQLRKTFTHMEFPALSDTGDMTRIPRRMQDILQDAEAAASVVGDRRRVVGFVAANHYFGFLTTIALPTVLNVPFRDARNTAQGDLHTEIRNGDLLTAGPARWRYIAHIVARMEDNVVGVSYGERMPAQLESALAAKGLAAFREFYGATETGLIGWRSAADEPFKLFPHWKRGACAPDAIAADISDPQCGEHDEQAQDRLIRIGPDGGEAAMRPMDALIWDSDRSFRIIGRRDSAVQISGVNVHPARIARIINDHPKIADSRIRVSFQRDGVCRLVAHILLRKNVELNNAVMRDIDYWCRKRLRPVERPRLYSFEPSGEALASLED